MIHYNHDNYIIYNILLLQFFSAPNKSSCDKACDKAYGCWGEGPKMCVKCKDYDVDGKCSTICPTEGLFFFFDY